VENIKIVNKYLLNVYGKALDNSPRFRVVWSEDVFETRRGFFEDYTEAGIFLRRYQGVRRVKKYSYLVDRFVLEAYTPEQRSSPEIEDGDRYEPLFVFDKKGQFLTPETWACDYVIHRYLLAMGGEVQKRTDSMDAQAHEEEIDKEAQKFVAYMEEDDSNIMQRFRNQEAVIVPSGYKES
jgi:hypothetical protein